MEELLAMFGFGGATHSYTRRGLASFPHNRSRAQQQAESLKRNQAIKSRNKRKAAKKANRGNQWS